MQKKRIQLGVNLDHVVTLRQVRGGNAPDFLMALRAAEKGGADGITVHLREDRRHIQEKDVWTVKRESHLPLNLEMSLAPEVVAFALKVKPPKVCLVPEKRQELTTEGGLNVIREKNRLSRVIPELQAKGIEVSLFVEPSLVQLEASAKTGADFVELHTGSYANRKGKPQSEELRRLILAGHVAHDIGLGVNAGHGLDLANVKTIVKKVPYLVELNIGHSIVSRAIFVGLERAVCEMKQAISRKIA